MVFLLPDVEYNAQVLDGMVEADSDMMGHGALQAWCAGSWCYLPGCNVATRSLFPHHFNREKHVKYSCISW